MDDHFDASAPPAGNTRFARAYRLVAATRKGRRKDKRVFARAERRRWRDYLRGVRPRARVASILDVA